MLIGRIPNATRNLGAPKNWDDKRDGLCGVLPIRDTVIEGNRFMVSAWLPTAEDLAALNAGAAVYLGINGVVHPVIFMEPGPVPEDGEAP